MATPKQGAGTLRGWWAEILALVVSLSVTLWAWQLAKTSAEQEARAHFDFRVNEIRMTIRTRMAAYEQILRGAAGLFAASGDVSRQGWHAYVEMLRLQQNYPGILGLGFAEHVRAGEKEAYLRRIRGDGLPGYTVWPTGARDEYTPVLYLEPFARPNRHVLGFDMSSEPIRRTALEQARDSGTAIVSGKVKLVQEPERDARTGFLMYLPVYRKGLPTGTVRQRRAALLGYVFAPLRMADLMRGILRRDKPDVGLDIFDGRGLSPAARLYGTDSHGRMDAGGEGFGLSSISTLDLNGHTWTLLIHSLIPFEAAVDRGKPLIILLSGSFIGLLLMAVIRSLSATRRRAVALAEEMTAALRESEHKYRSAINLTAEGFWLIDLERKTVEVNDSLCRMLGYTPVEMIGKTPFDFVDEENARVFSQQTSRIEQTNNRHYEIALKAKDGRNVPVLANATTVHGEDGRPSYAFAFMTDISEHKHAEDKLRLAAEVFNTASEGIVITDAATRIVAVNPSFSLITGYPDREVLGQTPKILASGRHDRDFYRAMWDGLNTVGKWQGEIWNRRKGGEVYPEWLSIATVKDHKGAVTNYVAVFSDITERKSSEERVRRLAHYDPLTELPNRLLLQEHLDQALLRRARTGEMVGLMFLDLDRFKQINDSLGHLVGDHLLQAVAKRLSACVRQSDTVSRLGGDEFLVLLPFIDDEHYAGQVAEKILRAMEAPFLIQQHSLQISTSIGIAIAPRHGTDPQTLMKSADIAMYRAKEGGRNGYRYFGPDV